MPPDKPKTAPGIRPRKIDDEQYLKRLRRIILTPYIKRLTRMESRAAQSYDFWRLAFHQIELDVETTGKTEAEVREQVVKITTYHRAKFNRSMSRALGIDVGPLTLGDDVGKVMTQAITDSVGLIKTIPPRLKEGLLGDMLSLAEEAPFNQAKVMDLLAKNYESSGYNLRRITRDQNNKLMGKLSEVRQVAVGIKEYVWSTAGDGRVRPSHRANEGLTFRWANPPGTGHPGYEIQCRCVAQGVIPEPERPLGVKITR